MDAWIWEDMNLDSSDDVDEYIQAFRAFKVGNHRVVVTVCKDGEAAFSIDGCSEIDNINPFAGAKILFKLLKAWDEIKNELKGTDIHPFCFPTETDGCVSRRIVMFIKAGFSQPDSEGKMICED